MDDSTRLELTPKPVSGTKEFIPGRTIPEKRLDRSPDIGLSSGFLHLLVPLDPHNCWPVALDGLEHRSSVRTRTPSLE